MTDNNRQMMDDRTIEFEGGNAEVGKIKSPLARETYVSQVSHP
jgi:hypothetical protein